MNLATIDGGGENSQQDFEKYFKNTDLFDLFKYDAKESDETCPTIELLLERDGFPIEETPTNVRHVAWLRTQDFVKGITLNANLYTNKSGSNDGQSENSELLPKQAESDLEESYDQQSDYSAPLQRRKA